MTLDYSGDCGIRPRLIWRNQHGWSVADIAEQLDVPSSVIQACIQDESYVPLDEDVETMNLNLGNLADDEPFSWDLGSAGEWAITGFHSPFWDELQIWSIRLPLGTHHFNWVYCGASEEGQPGQSDDFDPDDTTPYDAAVSLVGEAGFERLLHLRAYYTP